LNDGIITDIITRFADVERAARTAFVPVVRTATARLLLGEVSARQPKLLLEIGTGTGYSGLLLLSAAAHGGGRPHLYTVELNAERAELARGNFARFGFSDCASVLTGDAVGLLCSGGIAASVKTNPAGSPQDSAAVDKTETAAPPRDVKRDTASADNAAAAPVFDLIFLDGPKTKYPLFYRLLLPLLKPGGLLFADNVLMGGKVRGGVPFPRDKTTIIEGARAFLDIAGRDPSVDLRLFDVDDGAAAIVKKITAE
jgi:predicted O-methyltransferase YrrM